MKACYWTYLLVPLFVGVPMALFSWWRAFQTGQLIHILLCAAFLWHSVIGLNRAKQLRGRR